MTTDTFLKVVNFFKKAQNSIPPEPYCQTPSRCTEMQTIFFFKLINAAHRHSFSQSVMRSEICIRFKTNSAGQGATEIAT